MKFLLSILPILVCAISFGQTIDTAVVIQYNILNYRNHFDACTDTTNNVKNKEESLKIIVQYIKPDIVCFNEMQASAQSLDSLANNVMDSMYSHAAFSGSSFTANALFFKKNKFQLKASKAIVKDIQNNNLVRQIDVHLLYYLDPVALVNGDTTFLCLYLSHLKADNTLSDVNERILATEAIMNYHNVHYQNINYMLLGDLNVKSSGEIAYQQLINPSNSSIKFNDPVSRAGAWNSNSVFADIHTQSSRSADINEGCFSGGGLDDRFDFILCGSELMVGTRGMAYISGSYETLGNDGMHFNKDILSPANNSVPSAVLDALYTTSDHLPVIAKFSILKGLSAIKSLESQSDLWINNPVYGNLIIKSERHKLEAVELYTEMGKLCYSSYNLADYHLELDLSLFDPGFYVIAILQSGKWTFNKIVVIRQ